MRPVVGVIVIEGEEKIADDEVSSKLTSLGGSNAPNKIIYQSISVFRPININVTLLSSVAQTFIHFTHHLTIVSHCAASGVR
jgi:hypothetical protein